MRERPGGKPLSLWIATAGITAYAALDADIDVDVAVIGGGIAGLTAALALKRAGQAVAVLEAARVGTGVTGHTTGKVTSLHRLAYTELAGSHGEAAARTYGQANQAAIEHIASTVSRERIDCGFRRVTNYTYAETDDALDRVRDEASLAARLGLPSAFTSDVPLPFPVKGAVSFADQGQIHSVQYLQGLAAAVHGDGSFVFEESAATSLRDGSPAAVTTDRGFVRARDVIVATNVPFGDGGVFDARCYPHRSYLTASLATRPGFDDSFSRSSFISVDEPMRSILTADVDGTGYVLIGGEGHRASDVGDAAERYGRLAGFARDRLGAGEPAFRWSTQDAMPADGLPYVGPMSPESRHVHVITGLRKWGLTNGTAAALILSDTLCGRSNSWAAVFDSTRPSPATGAAAPVPAAPPAPVTTAPSSATAGRLVAGRPAGPAPGEGQILTVDGELQAVYAHPDGHIEAVSAICTHLGCTVGFNAADASWDCPCHGSRFATDGTVIQGPATKNLPRKPLP